VSCRQAASNSVTSALPVIRSESAIHKSISLCPADSERITGNAEVTEYLRLADNSREVLANMKFPVTKPIYIIGALRRVTMPNALSARCGSAVCSMRPYPDVGPGEALKLLSCRRTRVNFALGVPRNSFAQQ